MINKIRDLIKKGEGFQVEFKECKKALNKTVYDTVCSFLNRYGGDILLGVSDSGEIIGVDENCINQIKKEFTNTINNPQKLFPTCLLFIKDVEIDGKKILHIKVPQSSQVHRCGNKIFDRNEDSDLDISNNYSMVAKLYSNKQSIYTENKIFPNCKITDLRDDLIERARQMAMNKRHDHPWKNMSKLELLKSAKLFLTDQHEKLEGFTLAAILLFGNDYTIGSVIPHYKTDLILRRENLDRYDDRDIIETNLIESYDRIVVFAQKHLPDPFYTEGIQRISLRDNIFNELASNILIHREYLDAWPARIIIEKDRVYAENGNKPVGFGPIDLNNFTPHPKNPSIARVFREIGNADELGSGIRNLHKFLKFYSNAAPELIEGDVFKTILPLKVSSVDTLNDTIIDTLKLSNVQSTIINEIKKDKKVTAIDIANKHNTARITIIRNLSKLAEMGVIKRVGSKKTGHWEIILPHAGKIPPLR